MKIFVLSPASTTGKRAKLLLAPNARFELAVRLRSGSASLGEVFAFLSGLYFRAKLAYSRTFAAPPAGRMGAWVITSDNGLCPPDRLTSVDELKRFAETRIDHRVAAYTKPLRRDAKRLAEAIPPQGKVVLLGSVATRKYLEVLYGELGGRLLAPREFVGLGDMSRGALMLRAAAAERELEYESVEELVYRARESDACVRRR